MNNSFYKVWFARLISILGSSLTTFGVSVWVFEKTGKATPMAIVLLCTILPAILFAPISGIICDSYNRKNIIIIADSFAAFTTLALFAYLALGRYDFGVICMFNFLNSTANLFDSNAYQASLSTLIEERYLKKANGMNQIIDSVGSIIAPVCAGILYYPVGLKGLLCIDLISYLLAMILFVGVPAHNFYEESSLKPVFEKEKPQMSAGFSFIFNQRGLTLLMCFFAIFNFLMNIASSLTEPLALSISGSVALGTVQMAGGIGIFFGSIYITKHDIKLTYSFAIFCSACVAGLALLITGVGNHIAFMLIGQFLLLFVTPIVNTMAGTLWIIKTPKELQGRVYAARSMVSKCIVPVAYFIIGPVTDYLMPKFLSSENGLAILLSNSLGKGNLNYRCMYLLSGIIAIVCALLSFSRSSMKELGK